MPSGTLEIEVPDVGIVEFPAETKQADIEAILNRTYGPKAIPEVPEFKSPIELPPTKPGEKSIYEEPTWMDQPTVKLGDFLIKGPHEAKSPTEEGINKTLREGINSLTSPRNLLYMLGSMGVATTGQAAKALVGAIWTGAMGANAIENAPQLYARMGEEMAKPPEKRDKELLGQLGTQAFIDTGFFVAPALGLKSALTETPKITPTPEVTDASKVQETTTVHGDVSIDKPIKSETIPVSAQPETGISGGIGGRGGKRVDLVSKARDLSEALRKGNADDIQHQLEGAGMGPEELSRLASLVSAEGSAPLEAIRQSALRGRSVSQAVKAAIEVSNYQKETGIIGNKISADEIASIIGEKTGVPKESLGVSREVGETTETTQPERTIEHARQIEKATTFYGSLRSFPGKGVREVPVEESRAGVQPQAERGIPEAPQDKVALTPEQQAIEQARLAKEVEDIPEPPPAEEPPTTPEPTAPAAQKVQAEVAKGGEKDVTAEILDDASLAPTQQRKPTQEEVSRSGGLAGAIYGWGQTAAKTAEAASKAPKSKELTVTEKKLYDAIQDGTVTTRWSKQLQYGRWENVNKANMGDSMFRKTMTRLLQKGAIKLIEDGRNIRLVKQLESTPELSGPGTPAATQPPDPGGPLGLLPQLTQEVLRQQSESVKVPLSQRIDNALEISRRISKGKDVVTRSVANMRAASLAAWDKYAHLEPWTDFTTSLGRWIGADQKTSLEVRGFQKAMHKSVPQRIRQEAMTNWIQADGDLNVLRERAAASRGYVKRGYETALQLTEAEKHLARTAQVYLEARLKEGIDAGLLKQGVDNYITQIWKRPTATTQRMWADLFGVGTLNPNFKYARKRIFDSYFEGEQAGFEPKDKRVGSLIAAYDLAFNRALSARAFIKELQNGTAADGKPIAMTSGKTMPIPAGETPPEAFLIKPNYSPKGAVSEDGRPYRPIDHWALRDWKWATKGPEGQNVFVQGDMLVHPDHWSHLNKVLKTSRLRQVPVVRELLKAGAFAKQTKLSLSPFHYTQEGVHALAHRVNPANLTDINLEVPLQKALVDHGLMVSDPRAYELFSEGAAGGGLVGKIPGLGRLQTEFNDILFKDYIPRLKMTMALDAWERNKTAYAKQLKEGKINEDQLMALTARESNAAFGEQNYKMMGRSETLQDFFRLTMLAPDFLEARFRFVGQALKPYGREQRIALAFMAGFMYVGGRILNQYLDNDPHWDKPFSVFHKGREYRLRTVLGDVQHLITNPRSFWYNRMSPFLRTAVEYITSRDMRGIKRSSMEQLADAADWFKPISVSKRPEDTVLQTALTASGIPSQPSGAREEVYKLVDAWRQKQTDPKIREQYDRMRQETLPISPYEPLRKALRAGNAKAAQEAYTKLHQSRTRDTIIRALKPKPFTGGNATEAKFKAGLSEHEKAIYQKALKEQKDMLNLFYQLK